MTKKEYIVRVNYLQDISNPIAGIEEQDTAKISDLFSRFIHDKAQHVSQKKRINHMEPDVNPEPFNLDLRPSQFASVYKELEDIKQKSLRSFIRQLKYVESKEDIDLFYANAVYRDNGKSLKELRKILKFMREARAFNVNGKVNIAGFIRFFAVVDRLLSRRN
jgi:hypothetical protein